MLRPRLVAVAHGTRVPAGQAHIRSLVERAARRRPGLDISLSYVDVQRPKFAEMVAGADRRIVAVPLLLSCGYHVRVDIARAVGGRDAVAAPPLGPDQRLVESLGRALDAAGPADAVVLAAAGSSDPRSRADVAAVARMLPVPVRVGYAATAEPRVPDVVAALRMAGARRIVIAAYLLADGLFYRSLHRAGADAVTPPLAADPALVDLVLRRYDTAAGG
jgi:sirohydrochlorin ferrochelatase